MEDTLIEDDESFNISLATSSSDASVVAFSPEASVATVTIVQDPNDSKSLMMSLPVHGHNTMTITYYVTNNKCWYITTLSAFLLSI